MLVLTATASEKSWSDTLPLAALTNALDDLADGRGTEIAIGDETIDISAEANELVLPCGPLLVAGATDEWRKVVERELGDLYSLDLLPGVPVPKSWEGTREDFSVLDSD